MTDPKPEQPIKVITGSFALSDQALNEAREIRRAWDELEWIATHYKLATPEQRAKLGRFNEAAKRREDEDDEME